MHMVMLGSTKGPRVLMHDVFLEAVLAVMGGMALVAMLMHKVHEVHGPVAITRNPRSPSLGAG